MFSLQISPETSSVSSKSEAKEPVLPFFGVSIFEVHRKSRASVLPLTLPGNSLSL